MKSIGIIGAGYGGLALAALAARAGYTVTVYETHATPGGRTGLQEQDGFRFDTGPSWYLMPEVFEQYYQLFGRDAATELNLLRLTPGYKVFFEHDDPITIQGDLEKDAQVFEKLEPGAGAKLVSYVAKSKRAYSLALKHFLYTNFQRPTELFHLDILKNAPAMLALVSQPIDRYVSRTFHDRRLKQLLEYHMVFLGSSPFQAPALYSLMSVLDFSSGVYYPRNGMYSLIENLYDLAVSLGVTFKFSRPVRSIGIENGAIKGVELTEGKTVLHDIVVSGADLHFTETELVPPPYQSFPERYWRKRQPGPGALLISLGIKGALPQLQHHNLLFVDEWRDNFRAIYEDHVIPEHASLYVCNPTKTDPSVAPPDHENIFILVPLPSGVVLDETEQTKLVARFIGQFGAMVDAGDLASRITTQYVFGPNDFITQYHSWQAGALGGQSHLLFQSALFRTPNRSKKVKNLYYVGAGTTPGIGLPMCLMSAQLVMKRIVGDTHAGPLRPEQLTPVAKEPGDA